MVLGLEKFVDDGLPKLQVGKSIALAGELAILELRLTVPANELSPVTVMRHDPDPPGDEMLIVDELHPAAELTPAVPTLINTP